MAATGERVLVDSVALGIVKGLMIFCVGIVLPIGTIAGIVYAIVNDSCYGGCSADATAAASVALGLSWIVATFIALAVVSNKSTIGGMARAIRYSPPKRRQSESFMRKQGEQREFVRKHMNAEHVKE